MFVRPIVQRRIYLLLFGVPAQINTHILYTNNAIPSRYYNDSSVKFYYKVIRKAIIPSIAEDENTPTRKQAKRLTEEARVEDALPTDTPASLIIRSASSARVDEVARLETDTPSLSTK